MAESSSAPAGAALPTAARRVASRWISGLSRTSLAVVVLLFLTLIHLVGLATFTHGFLLTRLTIPEVSPAYNVSNPAPLSATHSKAVVIIIDALRTDFISPFPPDPPSPFHHNVLTLPAELTAKYPGRSLIFDSFSDPPTTTMQRLKGITTGSLPTFIDAGSNFASTAIEEDNLIAQANAANKSVVFMGDDTWLNLFPDSFAAAHPYDSFNVEDLHTVDNGVIQHLFPYLEKGGWDVLIGHFLGVDHVGHRVGPDRDTMRLKLEQMDAVLRKVVEQMDDDTLLVVLGDHGMNPKGDHGGDSPLETSAGLWLYSKRKTINHAAWSTAYAEETEGLRQINQIDLVPTLALMLGLPIPFNNLGNIIPEVFMDEPETFAAAANAVTSQIERYIKAYGNTDVLAKFAECRRNYAEALSSDMPIFVADANMKTNEAVLESLRELWAQFSMTYIVLGCILLALGVAATIALYIGVRNGGPRWDSYVRIALDTAISAGAGVGSVAGTVAGVYTREPFMAIQTFFAVAVGTASAVLAAPLLVGNTWRASLHWNMQQALGPLILFLHALSFASNSFVMWEDRVVTYLLVSVALFHVIRALTAPSANMRLRILGFGLLLALITRTMSLSTICREEQQPYCTVTFYEGNASNPQWSVYGLIPYLLMLLPRVIAVVMSWSKSFSGPAPVFVGAIWRAVLVLNALYWSLEWMETWDGLNPDRIPLVKTAKQWFARFSFGAIFGLMPYVWATSGLCVDVKREPDQTGNRDEEVVVLGFANAFGANYLLYVLIAWALVQLVSTPLAQFVLGGMIVAVLALLELTDTQRDAVLLQRGFAQAASKGQPGAFDGERGDALVRPSFTDAVPLALLGLVTFFATGHQAVLSSIQWKSAFVGFDTVTYPWSPALVILNTWGPIAFAATCVPLLALWNIAPRPNGSVPVIAHTLQMALAFTTYFATITLASAVTAAHLRRHLMVWKVFAPRFMLAGVTLVVVDVSLLLAVGFGTKITTWKVWRTFKSLSV